MELDAIRGLAAVSVMCIHFHNLFYDIHDIPWYQLPFVAGQPVSLFFVLSGYVLSLPYWGGRRPPYVQYLTRRFVRIYVPYAAAVVVALLAARPLLYSPLPLKPWFYFTWHSSLNARLIASQLLTMSTTPKINTAFWSLRYEMEFSILMPLACWLLARLRPWIGMVAIVVVLRAGMLLVNRSHTPMLLECGDSLIYGSLFLCGALLARHGEWIAAAYRRLPAALRGVLPVLVAASYLVSRIMLTPLACCGIIMLARYGWLSRVLDTTIPEYLGRISYSIYLLHGTVLWAVTILLYGKVPLWTIVLLYVGATLLLSHLFCIGVEEPSISLAKWLTRKKRPPLEAIV